MIKVMVSFLLFCFLTLAQGKAYLAQNNRYKSGKDVSVLVSTVHPFYNPGERYDYDKLPWPCRSMHGKARATEIGSKFVGERSRAAHEYHIKYLQPVHKKSLCGKIVLAPKEVKKFKAAINGHYEYQMFIDDLPLWGQVGFTRPGINGEQHHYLITHRDFHILYNKDRVIACNLTREFGRPVILPVEEGRNKPPLSVQVDFTYSVKWSPTKISFADRWSYNLHANPTRHQIEAHWLWVLNSSLLVVLLTGLLSMILLRTLKNDVARYLQLDQIDQEEAAEARLAGTYDEIDDSGWKRIRFDVFRSPSRPMLFSSVIGVGAQILMIMTFLMILAVVGYFYPGNHGRMVFASVMLYAVTSYVAGYVASAKCKQLGEEDWMISCLLTSTIFAIPFICVFALVNSVAIAWRSSIAMSGGTILACILLWAFVTIPLTMYGSYKGSQREVYDWPSKAKIIAKTIPDDLPWYYHWALQIFVSGFLPFMAIYVEVHTIFAAVWGRQWYTLFGILLLTFIILLIVTAFVVVLLCYFQLTAENHQWWWPSAIRGGSLGLFIEAYALFYWKYSSHMFGFLQGSMYFGYTLVVSYGFSLMLAAVGHWSCSWFIHKIYSAIKSD